MSIPGLDWGMDEVMGKDAKKVPQKKVPYAKPIPAQFQQVTPAAVHQRTPGHFLNLEAVRSFYLCILSNMFSRFSDIGTV